MGQLSDYFYDNVITGPSAFVEVIVGFSAYEEAIQRKLLRELVPSMVQSPGRSERGKTRLAWGSDPGLRR